MSRNKKEVPPQFWTDARQAQERIQNTFLMYDDAPVQVMAVRDAAGYEYEDGIDRIEYDEPGKGRKLAKMDDEKWKKFRVLPPLGWVNYASPDERYIGAVYLSRTSRNTRQHGLNSQNVTVYDFFHWATFGKSQVVEAQHIFSSEGYRECCAGEYPPLEDILAHIKEETAVAFSNRFAVYRCADGVRWLYRKRTRVGLFTGADTLSLFPKLGFYREEIMEDKLFTLNKIQEF